MPVLQETGSLFKVNPYCIHALYDAYNLSAYTRKVGIDEASTRKGHEYITLFVDMDNGRLPNIEDGRNGKAVEAFVAKTDKQAIAEMFMDMSPAFASGVSKHLPQARITCAACSQGAEAVSKTKPGASLPGL